MRLAALLFLLWLGAVVGQAPLGLSTAWAVLDAIRHGAAAGLVTVGLTPRYGLKPLVVACVAGVGLDLDHAVAAGSFDPTAMMALGVRPPTHSLVGAVVCGLVAWPVFGRAAGYAVTAGMLAHIVEDGLAWPGVPLLVPMVATPHVLLPVALAVVIVAALGLLSAVLGGSLRIGGAHPRCRVE